MDTGIGYIIPRTARTRKSLAKRKNSQGRIILESYMVEDIGLDLHVR